MSEHDHTNIRVLTVCGSLQRRSANRSALDVVREAVRERGPVVDDYDRLADMPGFNADLVDEPGDVVADWRRRVSAADVVVVATPEYAGAMAGVLKNALDWLVGCGELYRTPVAILSAGTSGGPHARRMTAQTLTWQGAYVVAELGIAAPRTKSDRAGRLTDGAVRAAVATLVDAALVAVSMSPADLVTRATRVVEAMGIDVAHVAPAAHG